MHHWRRWLKRAGLGALVAATLAGAGLWIAVVAVDFPPGLLAPATVESRRVHDRHGRLLREARGDADGRGTWRPLERISPWIPKAFAAIEDHRFGAHGGADLTGAARAAPHNPGA